MTAASPTKPPSCSISCGTPCTRWPTELAAGLGDRLRLASPVTRIEHGPAGVRVFSAAGTIEGRAVIVAVPPAMASKLDYSPPPAEPLAAALRAWRSGTVIKVLVRYPTAFWRKRGLSGMVMWRDPPGLFACDASPDDGHPALVVFIGGPLAVEWGKLGETALRAEVTARLTAALGPEAGEILDITLRDWNGDAWSGGGYSDLILDFNATDAERVLLKGMPPVHFASSELSPSFPGYIEGAIVAGRIAARKVIAGLAEPKGGLTARRIARQIDGSGRVAMPCETVKQASAISAKGGPGRTRGAPTRTCRSG